ncbi:Zinc knuckle family protein [Dirofilaria immitis]|nr:Zinc knuckle family protein [Dirofilaria immitis]
MSIITSDQLIKKKILRHLSEAEKLDLSPKSAKRRITTTVQGQETDYQGGNQPMQKSESKLEKGNYTTKSIAVRRKEREQFQSNIIEEVSLDMNKIDIIYDLSYPKVLTPSKLTTKLRIVCDASAYYKGMKDLKNVLYCGHTTDIIRSVPRPCTGNYMWPDNMIHQDSSNFACVEEDWYHTYLDNTKHCETQNEKCATNTRVFRWNEKELQITAYTEKLEN